MNYATLESAKRWQELGLFKDSEFAWYSKINWDQPEKVEVWTRDYDTLKTLLAPAPHCEELGDYLRKIGLRLVYFFGENFHLEQMKPNGEEVWHFMAKIEAGTETEAREKAINWYLDQTHSQ